MPVANYVLKNFYSICFTNISPVNILIPYNDVVVAGACEFLNTATALDLQLS